eukprot:15447091-Alexandrium_andersonii.AAC.1
MQISVDIVAFGGFVRESSSFPKFRLHCGATYLTSALQGRSKRSSAWHTVSEPYKGVLSVARGDGAKLQCR